MRLITTRHQVTRHITSALVQVLPLSLGHLLRWSEIGFLSSVLLYDVCLFALLFVVILRMTRLGMAQDIPLSLMIWSVPAAVMVNAAAFEVGFRGINNSVTNPIAEFYLWTFVFSFYIWN